ncbi:HNH endonuclease [Microbacter sp. GSS18]|nr:HNH endonuclease [Microbacter sp. GSS18]
MNSDFGSTLRPPVLSGVPEEDLAAELAWRSSAWRALVSRHPTAVAPAATIRELELYKGYRGVWVDKKRTASVWSPNGITIGVRHDGSSYADRLSETGLIYKFPETEVPGYDEMEVEATRTAMRLGLPIFVVSGHKDAPTRDARLAYIAACNDEAHEFLLTFVDAPIAAPASLSVSVSTTQRGWIAERVVSKPNDRRFAFEVVERYGPACAVCEMGERELLNSAHLRPRFAKGTDDPANGLVLCANHHIAMDAGLWRIDPEGLRVVPRPGRDLAYIGITRFDVSHLRARPSRESLEWLWHLKFKHVNSAIRPRR